MKIATKLTIIIIIISSLLTAISSYLIYKSTINSLQESIGVNQLQIARESMAHIDRTLYERYLDIQDLADSVILKKYLHNEASSEDVQKRLTSFFNTSGPWDLTKFVDSQGKVIFSSQDDLVGSSVLSKQNANIAFQKSIKGETYVSDVVISEDTGLPTIFFSAPVKQSTLGRPIVGVAIGQFSWPSIADIIESNTSKNTSVQLFNRQEQLISNNHSEIKAFSKKIKGYQNESIPEGKDYSGILDKSLISQAPQFGYLGYKGSGWELIVKTPTSIAFASAERNALKVIYYFAPVVFFSALFLIYLINVFFIVRLDKLVSIVDAISSGDTKIRAETESQDEIGQLATAFNKMTDNLLEVQSNIESKVKQRTKELEKVNRHMVNRELKMIELKQQIASLKQSQS